MPNSCMYGGARDQILQHESTGYIALIFVPAYHRSAQLLTPGIRRKGGLMHLYLQLHIASCPIAVAENHASAGG